VKQGHVGQHERSDFETLDELTHPADVIVIEVGECQQINPLPRGSPTVENIYAMGNELGR
jgi:hypothetical protein